MSREEHSFWLKLLGYSKNPWSYIWTKFQLEISQFNLFDKYLGIGQKFSKMVTTPKGRHMGPYPFGLFLVSPSPTYGQNITSKAFHHLGDFPRQTFTNFLKLSFRCQLIIINCHLEDVIDELIKNFKFIVRVLSFLFCLISFTNVY